MTLEFDCPRCGSFIAFPDKYAGRRAKCLTCKQRFIIPGQSGQRPQVVDEPQQVGHPQPGFYRAAFLDGWPLLIKGEGLTGLVMAQVATCAMFFWGHLDYTMQISAFLLYMPFGLILRLCSWGLLFWFYLEVISAASFGTGPLAELHLGDDLWERAFNVVKSLWFFAFGLFLTQLPYAVWSALGLGPGPVGAALQCLGLGLFPMVILNYGVNRDLTMLVRFDLMLRPVFKAFLPYLTSAIPLLVIWQLYLGTKAYVQLPSKDYAAILLWLGTRMVLQVLAIMAMRAIGLFYRHYSCYFGW